MQMMCCRRSGIAKRDTNDERMYFYVLEPARKKSGKDPCGVLSHRNE